MNLAIKYLPKYTLKDYEKWEGNWELIEGIAYALASPSVKHQRTVGKLFRFLDEAIEKECKNCLVGIDTDYIIDEHTVVRPDVYVTCEKVGEKLLKAPKIIFEVVSESTSEKDEGLKKELYEREGVEYYVLVYPEIKKARIFKLEEDKYKKVLDATEDTFTFNLAECKITLDFSKVWP
jgi:Uma2 family endonuclease